MKHSNKTEDQIKLDTVQARGARPVKGMPIVLGVSTLAAIIGGALAIAFFA